MYISDKLYLFVSFLYAHSSPILNFPLPKVPELDVPKSSSEIPKIEKLQETIRKQEIKQENWKGSLNLYLC